MENESWEPIKHIRKLNIYLRKFKKALLIYNFNEGAPTRSCVWRWLTATAGSRRTWRMSPTSTQPYTAPTPTMTILSPPNLPSSEPWTGASRAQKLFTRRTHGGQFDHTWWPEVGNAYGKVWEFCSWTSRTFESTRTINELLAGTTS